MIVLIALPAGPGVQCYQRFVYVFRGCASIGFVIAGSVSVHLNKKEKEESPGHIYLPVSILHLAANIFPVLVPFIPPDGDVFPVVSVSVHLLLVPSVGRKCGRDFGG